MAAKKGAEQLQRKSDTYTNVYFYDFGRWGVWAREPRVGGARLFIGTHLTERLAARCQDRALLKMEMEPWATKEIKLNFKREDYRDDQDLRNSTTTADFLKHLSGESRGRYNKLQPTACLLKFLAEEEGPLNVLAPEMPLEGPLGTLAPQRPVSRGKRPWSTTTKHNKKPKTNREWESSSQESDHCPSEPEVHAPLPLADIAPVAPLPRWGGERLRSSGATERRAPPLAAVVRRQTLAGSVAPWTTKRLRSGVIRAVSKDEEEAEDQEVASEALVTLALMPSREEEDASEALVMLLSSSGRGSARSGESWAISKDEEEAAEALLMLSLAPRINM